MPLWIGQKLQSSSPLYNMAFRYILRGKVDVPQFLTAWQRVIDANAILRGVVSENEEKPHLRIQPEGSCVTQLLDFRHKSEPEASFIQWAEQRCTRPLPLDQHLVDSVLVQLGTDHYGWYLNQHHLITDASSTVLLHQQFIQQYQTRAPSPPAASVDTTPLASPIAPKKPLTTAQQYWKAKKEESQFVTSFYGKNSSTNETRSERLGFTLSLEESQRLRAIANEPPFQSFFPDMSLFAVFATALTAWLSRLSHQNEFGFDAPAQLRSTPQSKSALGLFIEMFHFGVALDPLETFHSLGEKCLRETQQFLTHAEAGSYPYEEKKASNVVLNFFPTGFDSFEEIQSKATWVHSGHSDSVHAVRLQVHDYNQSGQYTLDFDFNEATFSKVQREQALHYFQILLSAFLDNRAHTISAVPVLSPIELNKIEEDYNAVEALRLPEQSVVAQLEKQIARTPGSIALEEGSRTVTFKELNELVSQWVVTLEKHQAQPHDRILIYMTRSIDAVSAILATLKIGATYIPIDTKQPPARIQSIITDSGSRLILTQRALAQKIDLKEASMLCSDELQTVGSKEQISCPAALEDTAYIIYTSGSTGTPKGVPITHLGLSAYLKWAETHYVKGQQLSYPLFTSLSFDLTVTSLFLPLITGGRLIIYPAQDGPVDSSLIEVINQNRVEFIKLTPSHLRLLAQMDLGNSRIARMVAGGENFPKHLATSIEQSFSNGIEIYNEYGPTEAVVGCMIHRFGSTIEDDNESSVPIGTPGNFSQIHVLNESLQPVPQGVPGELCISSPGLTHGYLNNPALNKDKFVTNPHAPDQRLYRSGDLARFNQSDKLELTYLGRIDRQLKVSGIRIESGEIEAALVTHPEITAAAVITKSRQVMTPQADAIIHCKHCGLPSNFPNVVFDEAQVCSICHSYEKIKPQAAAYFKTREELTEIFEASKQTHQSEYDCMVLLSGGKDSTYTLCQLVDMGLKVYAFTLDNGYISQGAKDNISRVIEALGVKHEFGTTPSMNLIFKDSLTRFSNVCNGCFKTVYTLSISRAKQLNIPMIVTGLSRGQFFETRLTENTFASGKFSNEQIDDAVSEARKVYHRLDDAVSENLNVEIFQDDQVFNDIRIVDFYRYCDVSLTELIAYLTKRVPWVRPEDTGRSTNCLINDVGIYIHKKERGFHNYALPYSWDVRMGHKTREEALDELNDSLDSHLISQMLDEVGYDETRLDTESTPAQIIAYYSAKQPISHSDLQRHLLNQLPPEVLPHSLVHIDAIPITSNGKTDEHALRAKELQQPDVQLEYQAAEGPAQIQILEIWQDTLNIQRIGVGNDFFQLGGSSLLAMEVILKICQTFEVDLPLHTLFQHKTIASLADQVEQSILEELESLSAEETENLIQQK